MEENKTKTIRSLKEMENDLSKKLNQELYDFKEELLQTEPKNILDNAYKVVVMQEIMDYLLYDRTYTRTELNALLDGENILQEAYDEWLSFDGNFREMLEYSTDNYVDMISDEYHKDIEKKLSAEQNENNYFSAIIPHDMEQQRTDSNNKLEKHENEVNSNKNKAR